MAGADKQQMALGALKGLNAAVTTKKLYPPRFPQVGKAMDSGFELCSEFLRKHGTLSLSLVDDEPRLCGLPVSQKTLGKIHGEDLFQQLRLLRLDHVVINTVIDRTVFNTLVTFFTTSPKIINNEGGGRAFVNSLGLEQIFPRRYTLEAADQEYGTEGFAAVVRSLQKDGRVQHQDIKIIASEIDGETAAGRQMFQALAAYRQKRESMADLVFGAIADVLSSIPESGKNGVPLSFTTILRNVDRIINEDERDILAKSVAGRCRDFLDDHAVYVVLLQRYSKGFGDELYDKLLAAVSKRLDTVVALMRREKAILYQAAGTSSRGYSTVTAGLERLLATDRGKQFVIREKARKQLEAGENERRTKRIQVGISNIVKGDMKSLRSREVVERLPATIESLVVKGKDRAAATIITNITHELSKGDGSNHGLLGGCLGKIGDALAHTEKWEWLERLSVPLVVWLKDADHSDEILENIVEILLKLQKYYWKAGRDRQADKILQLFFAIRTNKLPKNENVVDTISRLQDCSVERAALPDLLEKSVLQEGELIDRRLVMQGPLVARFLLNKLLESSVTEVRLKILELLRRFGPLLPPLLLEKLAGPMSWYAKRNLLKLLAETGHKKHALQVLDYLNHEDIRVQQEAFSCIYNLSGDELRENLLEALSFASGTVLEQIVRALTPVVNEEVIKEVAELLDDWKDISDDVREPLLIQAVKLLGKKPSQTAELALENFLQLEGRARAKNVEDSVWQAARKAQRDMEMVKKELAKKQSRQKHGPEVVGHSREESKERQTSFTGRTNYAEEAHIQTLLDQGEEGRARKLLVELIKKAAKIGRYQDAENLREWLIKIAPSALNDIIATAEVIEGAKREGISSDYLHVWSRLHDNLSSEEFGVLYHSMDHQTFSGEEVLVRQGEVKPALFFVNEGKVKLYYNDKSKEVLLKVIEQGEMFGSETFFEASIWTVGATVLERAEVSTLFLERTEDWQSEYPALQSKLHELSRKHGNMESHLKRSALGRRKYKRLKLHGIARLTIPGKKGQDAGVHMEGELADISRGGVSLQLRISKKKNARLLLGRNAYIGLLCDTSDHPGGRFHLEGQLVSVRSQYSMNNEFSVHVGFSRLLEEKELGEIIEAGHDEQE
ncbi:MAG: cyclic nucleotide-binding domain-containing protein [Desulfopila sp.]